ncbi:MAG: hypothetical protein KatS3mg105_3409 [Gemmatales bacterium]|nr:MAG: hypothetical protein KatS3mg105_3409 [Gemmatales bacterium]
MKGDRYQGYHLAKRRHMGGAACYQRKAAGHDGNDFGNDSIPSPTPTTWSSAIRFILSTSPTVMSIRFTWGAWARPYLIVRRDGHAKLIHDNRAPKSVEQAHVDERRVVSWYDGQSPGQGPRQLAVLQSVNPNASGLQIHDRVGDPMAANVINTIADMRRQKDRDEIEALKACMRATEAGHAWARENAAAGMTELDVYNGIFAACCKHAGKPVIVYGDFAVCDGPARRGGMATNRVLQNGDMLILDFSVVIDGYRSDFTNTLVIGKQPNSKQQHLFDMCRLAMSAGENELRAGASCLNVYQAVHEVFRQTNLADHFPHHAGHGLGLSHPEAPYFVRHANEDPSHWRRRHPRTRPLRRRSRRRPHRTQLPRYGKRLRTLEPARDQPGVELRPLRSSLL